MELLLVICISGVLILMLMPANSGRQKPGRSSYSLLGLHSLGISYQMYAGDNQGFLLPGYQTDLVVEDSEEGVLGSPVTDRYPWRLMHYFGKDWGALLYYDGNMPEDLLERSIHPPFGLNSWFLGGDSRQAGFENDAAVDGAALYYARRVEEVRNPAMQIVFGDSVWGEDGKSFDAVDGIGFHRIEPPIFRKSSWDLAGRKSARDVGYLAERWKGQTQVVFFDGHVERKKIEELANTLFWAPSAATSNYVVTDGP